MKDDSINVELTATLRAGLHRYTYPKVNDARLIIDMEPTIHDHHHPVTQIRIVNDSTITGMKYTKGWAKHHYVYFYAMFSSPLLISYILTPDIESVRVDVEKHIDYICVLDTPNDSHNGTFPSMLVSIGENGI